MADASSKIHQALGLLSVISQLNAGHGGHSASPADSLGWTFLFTAQPGHGLSEAQATRALQRAFCCFLLSQQCFASNILTVFANLFSPIFKPLILTKQTGNVLTKAQE